MVATLSADSVVKSRNVWCVKDRGKAWNDWIIDGVVPPRAMGACDTKALERVAAVAEKIGLAATPMSVFENGRRVIGAVPVERIESFLSRAKTPL